MLKIGLTGGIGSGKTAAAEQFARLGAEVIDTDVLSRELVAPGQPALEEIVDEFGADILTAAGELDRSRLREWIFANTEARERLEAILHPRIRSAMLARAQQASAPYVVFVVPLLIETGQQALVDRVLVIDVAENTQRRRVAARDGLSEAQIDRVLAAQATQDRRLRAADDVIDNDGGRADLARQVEQLHQQNLRQSRV